MAKLYADISRFIRDVRKWQSSTPCWLKMAMRVLNLPGGAGGLREPLGLEEINAQMRSAAG